MILFEDGESSEQLSKPLKQQKCLSHEIYIPAPLLAKIASLVAEEGVGDPKNWILAGREGVEAVLSNETLSRVRLDKSPHFIWWSMPHSTYYAFFQKCLAQKNKYAMFAEMSKGLAYESLVNSCYRRGHRALAYKHFVPTRVDFGGQRSVGYLYQPPTMHRVIGHPRCARCTRPGHTIRQCRYRFQP
ncbi:unnamed protein product [Arabidopsis halleri]